MIRIEYRSLLPRIETFSNHAILRNFLSYIKESYITKLRKLTQNRNFFDPGQQTSIFNPYSCFIVVLFINLTQLKHFSRKDFTVNLTRTWITLNVLNQFLFTISVFRLCWSHKSFHFSSIQEKNNKKHVVV